MYNINIYILNLNVIKDYLKIFIIQIKNVLDSIDDKEYLDYRINYNNIVDNITKINNNDNNYDKNFHDYLKNYI